MVMVVVVMGRPSHCPPASKQASGLEVPGVCSQLTDSAVPWRATEQCAAVPRLP